jgi:prepilin-type N-terminal cleavage/methylation domain-containing protein
MKKNGFTLVELIISMTISAMLMGGMLYAFGVEFNLWKKIVNTSEKQQIANMVFTRIIRDARNANEISPSSSNSTLSLKVGAESIEYSLVNSKVRRKKDGYSSYLTAAGDLMALSFFYPAAKQVEIKVEDFKTKVILRN